MLDGLSLIFGLLISGIGSLIFLYATGYSFAAGVDAARQALRVDPRAIGVWGMALAVLAGLASALAGFDPFTGLWLIVADFALSTVLVFDIGVYLAVFGAILTLVFTLEETL